MMKRGREEVSNVSSCIEEISISTSLEPVANCLVQISKGPLATRMFECKTCGRVFNSFQALGGHRASHHKKSKVIISTVEDKMNSFEAVKVKTVHECSICGMKFPLGQALGGHMRRHRVDDHHQPKRSEVVLKSGDEHEDVAKLVPVLMRSLSMNKRVMCMDLNLTPLENDLQLLFGKKAPKVDCKLVV